MALTDKLTAIADAIREKNGKTDGLTLDTMVSAIKGISGGGGDDVSKSLVERTITEYVNDEVTELGDYSFCNCTKLTNISCANVTSIRNNVFEGCSGLVSAILPRVTKTNNKVFSNCYALTEVVMPELKTVGSTFMQYCNALVSVTLPKLESTKSYTFDNCRSLEFLRLDNCASFDSFGIRSCPKLKTIILGHSSVCTLGGTSYLSGNNLTVYVPQALIESYQTATNWSTLYAAGTCNFVAIEGSEYE